MDTTVDHLTPLALHVRGKDAVYRHSASFHYEFEISFGESFIKLENFEMAAASQIYII